MWKRAPGREVHTGCGGAVEDIGRADEPQLNGGCPAA
jgi:hypothetical protein